MNRTLSFVLLFASSTAFAATDLAVRVDMPTGHDAYDFQTVQVTVHNVGSRSARDVMVTVLLPETSTSPTVHVLGDLDDIDPDCQLVGTALECDVGRVRRGRSTTLEFDIALPWSQAPINVGVIVSTSTTDSNPSNDLDQSTAEVNYPDLQLVGQQFITHHHCTGQGLNAFYDCVVSPSSITSHDVIFEANGSMTFAPGYSAYTGQWSQPTPDALVFEYRYNGTLVLEFSGDAVSAGSFEGMTTFPGRSWVSPYEVIVK
jgi:hypothetical protein